MEAGNHTSRYVVVERNRLQNNEFFTNQEQCSRWLDSNNFQDTHERRKRSERVQIGTLLGF